MEAGEITISLSSSLSKIMQRISKPGITNVWGRSGSGKTVLALNVAFDNILECKKVIYFTDQLDGIRYKIQDILKRGGLPRDFKNKLDDYFYIVNVNNFKNQIEIVQELFSIFPPGEDVTYTQEFRQFMQIKAGDQPSIAINKLYEYTNPSMIIFDEFSRQYRELSLASDPGKLSELIGVQLGFLKKIALKHSIPVILLNGTHTIKIKSAEDDENVSYQEAPLIHFALEYWEDLNARLSHTMNAGERTLTFSDKRKNGAPVVEKIQLNELFDRLLLISRGAIEK